LVIALFRLQIKAAVGLWLQAFLSIGLQGKRLRFLVELLHTPCSIERCDSLRWRKR
jgi:hypothetical protein